MKTGKVGVVGCGFVGSTAAYAMALEGVANELVEMIKQKNEDVLGSGKRMESVLRVSGTPINLNTNEVHHGRQYS